MGAQAKETPAMLGPAVAGAVLSTVATVMQLALLLAVASPQVLYTMALPLAAAGVAALLYAWLFSPSSMPNGPADQRLLGEAFDLSGALKLAGLLAAVLVASAALTERYGNTGTLIAAGMAGLADTHAPSVSIAGLVAGHKLAAADAVRPILLAMTMNTITKGLLAQTSGGGAFARRVVPGLAVVIVAAWLGAAFG
jgi:uncharacterized membrane protein (DUF4010 family)